MARSIENSFYQSTTWQNVRGAFIQVHPLCELCLLEGKYTPAEIVHHKKPLTVKNFKDPNLSLNPSNLQSVCRDCHNKIHFKQNSKRRYEALPTGEIIAIDLDEI